MPSIENGPIFVGLLGTENEKTDYHFFEQHPLPVLDALEAERRGSEYIQVSRALRVIPHV